GDTDDNMRVMQVRALLHGQDWYDLRQYKLNPPFGADMHWSHLVDLPLAGLILLFRLFVSGPRAEMAAVAVAPLLAYLVLLFGVALTARRLIGPHAYLLAILAMVFAPSANGMFAPLRIDHHGWQLALLSIAVAAVYLGIAGWLGVVAGDHSNKLLQSQPFSPPQFWLYSFFRNRVARRSTSTFNLSISS
ncbi:MAG: hypothetical protein KY428_09530, partial [Bacteroidetes bacterium]|nr:hypothetical protein [Bacteroidota bacterium]